MALRLRKVLRAAVNPVGAGIERLTGISQRDQLLMGAGIGAGTFGARFLGGANGNPQGQSAVLPASEGGLNSGWSVRNWLPYALPAVGSWLGGREAADAARDANAANVALAREQMSFSARQAAEQMEFQERMSNTSMRRSIEDMKAAGLNPILSAGGGGANSPSGASGSAAGANVMAIPSVLLSTLSGALDGIRTLASVEQAQANTDLARSGIPVRVEEKLRTEAQTRESKARAVGSEYENEQTRRRLWVEGSKAKGRLGKTWSAMWGLLDAVAERIGVSLSGSKSVSRRK